MVEAKSLKIQPEEDDGMLTERGRFSVSNVFSDDMVVQRDAAFSVTGTASEQDDGKWVEVAFRGASACGRIENGAWEARFESPFAADSEGHVLAVSVDGEAVVSFRGVLTGDVWLVGGQSNASMPICGSHTGNGRLLYDLYRDCIDSASREHPIRLFRQRETELFESPYPKDTPQRNAVSGGGWSFADRDALMPEQGSFSAIGYFFARRMAELNPAVPVGVVMCACGGVPLSLLAPAEAEKRFPASMAGRHASFGECRLEASQIYNAMTAPFEQLTCRGMLFFQGEADARKADVYDLALRLYIDALRVRFGNERLLFLNVQLTTYGEAVLLDDGTEIRIDSGDFVEAPNLRMAQTRVKTGGCPDYEVVCSMDTGWLPGQPDGAHAIRKKPVGDRMALAAACLVYGAGRYEDCICPYPVAAAYHDGSVVVSFACASAGLKAKRGALKGFEVYLGGEWRRADAVAEGDAVRVFCDGTADGVRYGHALRVLDDDTSNLIAASGLPAVAFELTK